eukprot:3011797-Karenia_brevis.AAC.1
MIKIPAIPTTIFVQKVASTIMTGEGNRSEDWSPTFPDSGRHTRGVMDDTTTDRGWGGIARHQPRGV